MNAETTEQTCNCVSMLGELANVSVAVFAGLGLLLAWRQLTHQSYVRDFEAILELNRELGRAWEVYRNSADDRLFHFGQLVSTYEMACYMFNHDVLGPRVRALFQQQIIEVFTRFMGYEASMVCCAKFIPGKPPTVR